MDAAMTAEDGLLCLKEAIKELSEGDQARVSECADWLRKMVKQFGDCGLIAMALVGSELTAEQEKQNMAN